jgi:hypothetical protein
MFSALVVFPSRRQWSTNPEATMTFMRAAAMLALIGIGITSLGGCVVREHRDGGVTVRPAHVE